MAQNALDEILAVFERRTSFEDPIGDLVSALKDEPKSDQLADDPELPDTALGIDTNVLLRLVAHKKAYNAVDYLAKVHKAPLILPGQSIQEFWNNRSNVIETVSRKLWKAYKEFKKYVDEIGDDFDEHMSSIEKDLRDFENKYKKVYDQSTLDSMMSVLETLQKGAIVPFCPRAPFCNIVSHRNNTKTPPGFMDTGDGDFFIWVDFLYGLRQQQLKGSKFSHVVFVTNDAKVDWSVGNTAHPILVSEVRAVLDVSFEIWDLNKFIKETTAATS